MRHEGVRVTSLSFLLLLAVGCGGGTQPQQDSTAVTEPAEPTEPTAGEQVAAMEAECIATAEAMAARQVEATLYDRLGGRDAIHAVVADVVRRHHQNGTIAHLLDGVDEAHLIEQVTDFIAESSGGDVSYEGRDMVSAHEHLRLTNEHFLAAGADVQAALEAAGVGPGEIQEVMCMFVSLRPEVVLADAEGGA